MTHSSSVGFGRPPALVTIAGAVSSLFYLSACSGTSAPDDSNAGTSSSAGGGGGASAISRAGNGGAPAAAGAGSGGAPGIAGASGSAGSGSSTAGAATLVVDCGSLKYTDVLTDCTMIGCHRPPAPTSMLNLTPDAGLVSRLKDVKAQHGDITCPPDFNVCVPASCDPNALLVNSANPAQSWIVMKLRGTQNGCGDQMPDPEYDPAREQCLEKMVNAIAALPK